MSLIGKSKNGAPGEIRTPGLLVRSQALYPTELRARKGREYYHINQRAPFRRVLAQREGLLGAARLAPCGAALTGVTPASSLSR